MGDTTHDGLAIPGRAILAHEPAFRLGTCKVDPATLQIAARTGQYTLQPRVAQVLVVLAKASGQVVTRDELVDRCWDGRIVGDDAINRIIAKIRHVAQLTGGAFGVETIPRVGYRLVEDGHPAAIVDPELAPQPRPSRRKFILGAGAAAGSAAAAGAFFMLASPANRPIPLARAHYERGIAARGQGNSEQYAQAVHHLREATRLDPESAAAWGALAWAYRSLIADGSGADSPRLSIYATSAARRALELDPDNPDAQAALLLLRPVFGRWAEVESGLRQLLKKHPGYSIGQFCLAYALTETGRWREAIPHMRAVAEREPMWPAASFGLFEALRSSGRLEEADARLSEVTRASPRNLGVWLTRAHHLMLTGRGAEALALVNDPASRPVADSRAIETEQLIVQAFVSGASSARDAVLSRLLDPARVNSPGIAMWAAMNVALLGHLDGAYALLNGFYLGRGPWAATKSGWPVTNTILNLESEALRRDSRFTALLRDIRLEAFWQATGSQPDFRRFLD